MTPHSPDRLPWRRTASCFVVLVWFSLVVRLDAQWLALNVPQNGTEGATLIGAGIVSLDGNTNQTPVTVQLFSDNTNRVRVPPFVILPPGTNTVTFDLVLPDDDLITRAEDVFIEAWLDESAFDFDLIRVQDNESRALGIGLPAQAAKGQGTLTNAGNILFSGRPVTNVVLALQSNHPELISVPALVTNLAGETSVWFHLTVTNDAVTNVFNDVRLTASAPGFLSVTGTVAWFDGALMSPPANLTPADLAVGVSSVTGLEWTPSSNAPPGTVHEIYFGTSPTFGAAELLGTGSNRWTLPLLAPATRYYWQIVARGPVTKPGPVWSFTTRGADHYAWSDVDSPQTAGEPFNVTLTARDELDRIVTNYTGLVELHPRAEGREAGSFLPLSTNNYSFFATSKTVGYSFTPSNDLTVTAARHLFGQKISFWTESGVLLLAQSLTSSLGNWTETPLAAPLLLKAGHRYRVGIWVVNGNFYGEPAGPMSFPHGAIHQACEADFDSFPASASASLVWSVDFLYRASVPMGEALFQSGSVVLENGIWSGAIWVSRGTNVVLFATDDDELRGLSQPFHVIPPGQAPVFLPWQASQLVRPGSNVTLAVDVFGAAPLAYQWRRNGTNLLDDARISGTAGTELSITNFQPTDAGAYDVVAVNEFGRATNSAASLVLDRIDRWNWQPLAGTAQKIIGQPFNAVIQAYTVSNLVVPNCNCPGPTAWSGVGDGGVTVTPIVSGTFSGSTWTGTITVNQPVTNLVLRADDGVGHFGVTPPFHVAPPNQGPVLLTAPTNLVLRVGQTARFSGSIYGGPSIFYSWNFTNQAIQNGGRFSGQGTTTLTISNVIESDSRIYNVVMGNGLGPALVRSASLAVYRQDHFTWGGIPSPQSIYQPVPVRLEARDASNLLVSNFTGAVSLSASLAGSGTPVPVTPVVLSNFTGGVWSGAVSITQPVSNVVLRAEDALGHVGVSAPFNLERIISFHLQPANQFVLPGTNVTLVAAAVGAGAVRYQWRFEGTNLPNATNASLSFSNANLAEHHGSFSVVVSDDLGSITSSNAFLYVLVRPGIVTAPRAQTVLQGGTAIFSCVATGAPPLSWRWISNSAPFATSSVPFLALSNAQPRVPPLNIRVIVQNAAGSTLASASTNVQLVVLADFDQDGMADAWENGFGFSTNDAANALLDADGDGLPNRAEYLAGTDPTSAASVLKIFLTATNAGLLQFIAQSNIAYGVEQRTSLSHGSWSAFTSLAAQAFQRTVQVSVPHPPPTRFYRIVTPPEP